MSTAPTPSAVPEVQPTPVASASTDDSVAWLIEPQEAKDDERADQPVRQYDGDVAAAAAVDDSGHVEPVQEGSDGMLDIDPAMPDRPDGRVMPNEQGDGAAADRGAGHVNSLPNDPSVQHAARPHAAALLCFCFSLCFLVVSAQTTEGGRV